MVSALIIPKTSSVHRDQLDLLVDTLHAVQIFEIIVLYEGNSHQNNFTGLPVNFVPSTMKGELAVIAEGIAACQTKDISGVLIIPSDFSNISARLLVSLLHQFWISHKEIVKSGMIGNGEIYVLAESLFEEIRHSDPGDSLHAYVTRQGERVHQIEFDPESNLVRGLPKKNNQTNEAES